MVVLLLQTVPVAAGSSAVGYDAFPAPPRVDRIGALPANYSPGRAGQRITYIVIHDTEISFERAVAAFKSPWSGVSAHYVIRGIDGHVVQTVDDGETAWHAGNWWYNQRAIGIEHELDRIANPRFTEPQYRASAALVCELAARYDIPLDRAHVFGHVEVPGQTRQHFDPGPTWDWPHYMWLLSRCARPSAAALGARWAGQTYPGPLSFGARTTVTIRLRNTGSASWRKGTPAEIRLGVPGDDRSRAFLGVGWPSPERAAVQTEAIVPPGSVATFRFTVAGVRRGRYLLPLRPVVDGIAWLQDEGIFTVIDVR